MSETPRQPLPTPEPETSNRQSSKKKTVPSSKIGPNPDNGGDDAVCFTAGFAGAMFGVGTIHAYLAADRKPPQVAAGISMGALNAAALQRCYREMKSAGEADAVHREVFRWKWFRRYLTLLVDRPLGVIWKGLPGQSDFAADLPPVRDASVEEIGGQSVTRDYWTALEKLARRELYLFKKLGNWVARLPLKVSTVADFLVTYIRVKEQIPGWKGLWRWKLRLMSPVKLFWPILWHVCWSPEWFSEAKFQTQKYSELKYYHPSYWIRPLFGWPIFLLAWGTMLALALALAFLTHALWEYQPFKLILYAGLLLILVVPAAVFLIVISLATTRAIKKLLHRKRGPADVGALRLLVNKLTRSLFKALEMDKSLVNNFHLRLQLARLFGERDKPIRLSMKPMPLVIVAAPLQTLKKRGVHRGVPQVWARKSARLVDVLVAALAVPGLFEPLHLERPALKDRKPGKTYDLDRWEVDDSVTVLDLVDGSVVRENPLPALFEFIKMPGRQGIANALSSSPGDPRVHVVFTVPMGAQKGSLKPGPLGINIVDVLITSLRLNRRRDTKLEILQNNFLGQLEFELRTLAGKPSGKLHPIFADSISPERDLRFENPLGPTAQEVLESTATGCRRTLQTLYARQLENFAVGAPVVECHDFLTTIAPSRDWDLHPVTAPGLREVCEHCSRKLERQNRASRPAVDTTLTEKFPQLKGENPRIVFLASGGVFRGSFHVGMLACMLATDIRPDVIVGASVGTLLGGALGALLTASDDSRQISYEFSLRLLGQLTDVLLCVDQRIAFTTTLKSAVRELGIRARGVRFSPSQIRRMVRRGGRSDPGFAATGAPPALIDSLSNLLLVPNRETSRIAADFVAGHVTSATKDLLLQMRSETLRRLDIEYAMMGVSLLEPTAKRLLGDGYGIRLDVSQPFQCDNIAFFGTTTNLNDETPHLLGLYRVGKAATYDFVQAALASSAFPAIFAPRREADIFPGTGRSDVLFSDGGMFDNLPFMFTLQLLANVQRLHRAETGLDSIEFLRRRHANPDLFIAGSLNVPPENEANDDRGVDDVLTIARRAGSLQYNVKIRGFQDTADLVSAEVETLLNAVPDGTALRPRSTAMIDGLVEASVLPVFPIDRNHLNPTYAFCASTGLERGRVQRSIANGCFQTFGALANAQSRSPAPDLIQAARSLDALGKSGRVPSIQWAGSSAGSAEPHGSCPYFRHSRERQIRKLGEPQRYPVNAPPREFCCPFFQAGTGNSRGIFEVCSADTEHLAEAARHYPSS